MMKKKKQWIFIGKYIMAFLKKFKKNANRKLLSIIFDQTKQNFI